MEQTGKDEARTARYQVNPNFILREVAQEAVLVPVGDAGRFEGTMISLNATSLFLWKVFEQPHTIAEAIEAAKAAYDDPSGRMEQEITLFVNEYVRVGLMKEVEIDE